MLFNYYKGEPNTYTLCYRNGKLVRHGAGINFVYSPLTTSIAAVPPASREAPFIFNETTADYQEVAIQGMLAYRLTDPLELATRLDFTIHPRSRNYLGMDPENLVQRVVNTVQAHTRSEVNELSLEDALNRVRDLSALILERVAAAPELKRFGIELEGLHFTSVKATPEMQKALEADYRESLHKRADLAIYDRRKSAVEEERKIRESEMNTDVELELRGPNSTISSLASIPKRRRGSTCSRPASGSNRSRLRTRNNRHCSKRYGRRFLQPSGRR